MSVSPMRIRSRLGNYTVESGSLESIAHSFDLERDFLLVDGFVVDHYGPRVLGSLPSDRCVVIRALERNKTLQYASKIIETIMLMGITKRTRIISVGGGIVQDLSGFVASILYRGLEWHFYPSTLLAQTDSCIGAKTSINFLSFKNLVGTFYNPTKVIRVPGFLETLSRREFFSGMGEIIKLHIIGGRELTAELLQLAGDLERREGKATERVISNSLRVKKRFIEEDEFDKGIRNLLNYGHCIGHAIEASTKYGIPHGQAVTLGMLLANRIAVSRGELSRNKAELLEKDLFRPFVEARNWKKTLPADSILEAMRRDKKRVGKKLVVIYLNDDDEILKREDVDDEEVRIQLASWNGRT